MSDKKKGLEKSLFSAGGLILILLILVFVNFIFSRVNIRWDATKDKLYSLSEGTQKIISNLEEDVVIKVFYSKSAENIPAHIKNYSKRMLDFLKEYEHYSKGKVTIEVYDPKIDSDEEEWAQKYGIEPVNLPTGDRIYFGLVASAADQEETIKMMDPAGEKRLEYNITRIISRVQSPEMQKIGIISGLPVFGQRPNPYTRQPQQPPWQFIKELSKTYEVSNISLTAQRINSDIDLLILIHPKGMSKNAQFAVDQFILNGGKAIIFADSFSTIDGSPGNTKAASLDGLFKAWGVFMEDKVLADFDFLTKVRARGNQIEDNPFWLSLPADSFNADNIVTAKLESLLLPMAGTIREEGKSDLVYEPLLQSSANSALEKSEKVRMTANEIRREFKSANKKYDLAVKLSGIFKTAFPEGKPPAEAKPPNAATDEKAKKPENPATVLKVGNKPSAVIIIADSDMIYDGYYVQQQNFLGFDIARIFNDNLNFLLNAAEMLAGGQDLISIRSRGKFEKPFIRVQELAKIAQAKWLSREQELMKKVDETNEKLSQMEQQKDDSQKLLISKAQEEEIKKFQEEKRRINKELKKVRRNLRADIEALGVSVKLINIFLMPFLVAIAGIAFALHRRRKSQRI
jgi:gliding-associated putative ABC transporter substrate-binding component GldG